VKSKVSGANFGCLKLALLAIVLGIILLVEILYVIKGDLQTQEALLKSNIENLKLAPQTAQTLPKPCSQVLEG